MGPSGVLCNLPHLLERVFLAEVGFDFIEGRNFRVVPQRNPRVNMEVLSTIHLVMRTDIEQNDLVFGDVQDEDDPVRVG